MLDLVQKYFPELSTKQKEQFLQLEELYKHWNSQINVISRKDMDELYIRHVLHSLAIAKRIQFVDNSSILDIGTGGGFPGIPLAILFPNCHFTLIDSIGKKIKVVQEVAKSLQLNNVTAIHGRAEKTLDKFDFIVSRAVTNLKAFKPWVKGKFKKENNNDLANGVLYLKGGDLTNEIKEAKIKCELTPVSNYFSEDFFETKYVMYFKAIN